MTARGIQQDADFYDGLYLEEYRVCAHEGKIYRRLSQPDRDLILKRNAELRKNPGVIRDLSFARHTFSIPKIDFEILKQKYPVLVDGDADSQRKFYVWFLRQSESLPYRVQA